MLQGQAVHGARVMQEEGNPFLIEFRDGIKRKLEECRKVINQQFIILQELNAAHKDELMLEKVLIEAFELAVGANHESIAKANVANMSEKDWKKSQNV
jgi:hypothetical protein